MLDAAACGRFEDAMEVLRWCRQWPGETSAGEEVDLGYFTNEGLHIIGRGPRGQSRCEANVVPAALILRQYPDLRLPASWDSFLKTGSAFPPPKAEAEAKAGAKTTSRFEQSIDERMARLFAKTLCAYRRVFSLGGRFASLTRKFSTGPKSRLIAFFVGRGARSTSDSRLAIRDF